MAYPPERWPGGFVGYYSEWLMWLKHYDNYRWRERRFKLLDSTSLSTKIVVKVD